MLNPKRDGTVESHPFDSAQGRLFRKVRGRMGHPRFADTDGELGIAPVQWSLVGRSVSDFKRSARLFGCKMSASLKGGQYAFFPL
jgi:hypothetical protein